MAIALQRTASQKLTHVGLVLSPRRSARRRIVQALLPSVAAAVGIGLGYFADDLADRIAPAPPPAPSLEIVRLQQQLDEARSALRLAGAHSQELETQIDALNHRLRENTVELTFVKKAREGRQP